MFITGPTVIKQVTGEVVTPRSSAAPEAHMRTSGVVHFVADDDAPRDRDLQEAAELFAVEQLGRPADDASSRSIALDPVARRHPAREPAAAYDMREVIGGVVDDGDFLEVQAQYAANMIVGFARVWGGRSASSPISRWCKAGALDIDASDKASRFIRFCNAFNIPLVTLVDVPGFMPGVEQEYGGIIRHGAKLLFAYSAATVPKITIILRKAYGGAYVAMCAQGPGADRVPPGRRAEIAVMGAEGAVRVDFPQGDRGGRDRGRARARSSSTTTATRSPTPTSPPARA